MAKYYLDLFHLFGIVKDSTRLLADKGKCENRTKHIQCTFPFLRRRHKNPPQAPFSPCKNQCVWKEAVKQTLLCASPLKQVSINANPCKRGLTGDGLMLTTPSLRCSQVVAAGGNLNLPAGDLRHMKSRWSPRILMRPAYFYDVIKSVRVKVIMTLWFNPPAPLTRTTSHMVDLSGGVDPTWERPQWIRCRSLRLWDFQKKRQRMVPIWLLLPCVGPLSVTSRVRASLAGGTAAVRQVKTSPVSSTALWGWWFLSAGRAAAGLDGQRRPETVRREWEPAALLPPSSRFFFFGFLLQHGRIGFTASSNCTHDFPSIGRRLQILNRRFSGFSLQFKRRPRRPVSTSALSGGRGERKVCVRFGEFDAWETRPFNLCQSVCDT